MKRTDKTRAVKRISAAKRTFYASRHTQALPARHSEIPPQPGCCPYCQQTGTPEALGSNLTRCTACGFVHPLPAELKPADDDARAGRHADFTPGRLLRDRYRLIGMLGEGTHGVTYLAHHEFLNHPCVLKLLPYRVDNDSDAAVRRLRNEACSGFRVSHPNVVRVLDGDAIEGTWYFVMEYVDGVDLAQIARRTQRIDWRQALRIAIEVAHGLDAIHASGLLHLDIKPANLILGADGRVRIADLGVARMLRSHTPLNLPLGSTPSGTLAYASPELLASESPEIPADLYALGATLFQLTTGALPHGGSLYQTLLDSVDGLVQWPANAPANIPEWFVSAILKLLARDPAKRFPSARALAEHLEAPGNRHPATTPHKTQEPTIQANSFVVLPLRNAGTETADDWLGHALADHLARRLAQVPGSYVADVNQFLQTLERIEKRGNQTRGESLREAGRLSGAANVIEGTFRRDGDLVAISMSAHAVGQPETPRLETIRGELSRLADVEGRLFEHIAQALSIKQPTAATLADGNNIALDAQECFFSARRYFLSGDYESAMKLGKQAIEHDPDFGEALGFVGACCARMGRYDEAVGFNRQQQELAEHSGDECLMVQAHANLGSMHYFRGQYAQAEECLNRAAELADRLNLSTEQAQIVNNLGFVRLQLDRRTEAARTFARAIEMLKRYGALVALIGPYNGMGHVLREEQRYDEARAYFQRALGLAQESDDDVNMGVAQMNLGHCALLQGRLADAKHELLIALNVLEKTSFWNGLARVYEHMAELNLRLSNFAEALRCAEMRLALAQRHENRHMEAAAGKQKATALKLAGRTDEAQQTLAEVARLEADGQP